jgi:hypothetical protein
MRYRENQTVTSHLLAAADRGEWIKTQENG